ncbi:hypothetical protein CWO84_23975 [Methylomonas sp. Kb3]|uniref:Gfo/Idh/MocA family protein n=1 Tax=Methylomonas sp. Kb3 TaxID=1611544 RepID=UPI000C344FC1|nr:Gfo/Idh/MocA family oxidoreductase [Methylomonas sp. Kb3]PKD38268.1 hypothetical protein CWO84_23975 [Methylomonas sp. Kb3]
MTASGKLKVALIGTGNQGLEHLLPALRRCSSIEVTFVISRLLDSAKAVSTEWGVGRYGNSWEAMLEDFDCPDAIVIAVNPELHQSVAKVALEQGKSIFVEKPPAVGLNALKSLCEIEAKSSSVAFVGYNFAFSEQYKKALEIANQRGGIASADYRFVSSKPTSPGTYEGIIERLVWDTLIHPANLATRALGQIASTDARLLKVNSDNYSILVTTIHKIGSVSHIEVGNYHNRFQFDVRFVTHDGTTIEIDGLRDIEISYGKGHVPSVGSKEVILYQYPIRRDSSQITGYLPALKEFFKSVATCSPSKSSLADSVTTYELLEAVLTQIQLNQGGTTS